MRYIIVIVIIFTIAALIRPDLVWPLLVALGICVMAVFYSKNVQENSSLAVIRKKKQNDQDLESICAAFLSALQYPAYILDHRGAVRFANQASIDLFGKLNQGDLITIRFRQPDFTKFIEEALHTSNPTQTNYSERVPNDRWFEVGMAPIFKHQETPFGNAKLYILGFQDLTNAKRTEQMRSDFIANASHELRTPIASLLGYIETIRGTAKNDKEATERFLGIMQDQAERMTRLVNDLLSLSRIEMQSHVPPSDHVNITGVVETVTNSLDELAKQMKVAIIFERPEDIFIMGDEDGLIQVFENLIENACKYGDEGQTVDVSISQDQVHKSNFATVTVRDYGRGIAKEDLQRITERFYRVDVARSREKQGTGLGLAIVKHILNRHKARLVIKSNLGEGSEFSVTFPILETVGK